MLALVVDDDAMNRELLRRMLERLGWRVTDAQSGRAAIEACAASSFGLVLLDYVMPGLNGFDTAAGIRDVYAANGFHPCLIAVTGSDLLADDKLSVFDGFLQKPFILDELADCIAACSHR